MEKTIFVRRSVLAAVRELETAAAVYDGLNPLDLAEDRIDECARAGDETGARVWRNAWLHLMVTRYTPAPVRVIEDDGERPRITPVHNSA